MAAGHIGTTWKLNFVTAVLLIFSVPLFSSVSPTITDRLSERPIDVIKAYLKATHAHDFRAAYQYISTIDRNFRDENRYLRSGATFSGFALEVAKRLAEDMEVWLVDEKLSPSRARFEVGYRVPAGDEIASQLFDWNPDKLNALSPGEQRRLFEAVDGVKNRGKMITIEGRETFDLVQEKSGWKIFLDWSSRTRIVFKALQPRSGDLEIRFLRNDFLVKTDDPFQIDFTVRNQSDRSTIVSLTHRFEPRRMAENVDMVACGSLAPFRLGPQAIQGMSSHYLLRAAIPKPTRLSIIYDFNTLPAVVERKKAP
jgi:hypothetical protein